MSNRTWRGRYLVGLALAPILAVAACSSSNTTATGSSATTGGTTPGGKVVTIGVIAPLNSGLTEFGAGIKNSTQLAVDEANKKGAIPGYTIKLVAEDDGSDPAKGEAAARSLAADPTVIGVVGPYNSGVAAKAAPILAAAGIPLISPSNTDPTLTLGPDVTNPSRPNATYFRMVGTDLGQAAFLAQQAKAKDAATTVAVVSETKAVSKGLADNFVTAFTKEGGTVPVQQVVPDAATDFSGFITAAKAANPSLVFFGGEYKVAATLRQQATAAGLTVPIMGGDGMKDDAYLTAAGADAKGDQASSVGAPIATLESAKDYLAAYKAAGFTQPTTDYGAYSYDAANLLIASAGKALASKSAVDAAARSAVVSDVQAADTKGASGAIGFDRYGDTKSPVFTLYGVADVAGKLAWDPLVTAAVKID